MRDQQKTYFSDIRSYARRLAYSPLPSVLLAASFVLSEYLDNITLIYPLNLLITLFEAILIGAAPFLIFRRILSSQLAVTIAAFLAVPLFYNYEPRISVFGPILKALFPVSDDTVINFIFIIILLGLCALIGWASARIIGHFKIQPIAAAHFMVLVIVVIFSFETIAVGVRTVQLLPQILASSPPIAGHSSGPAVSKPDIYYIVLEDYASNDTLKSIYNYDNKPFLDYLTGKDFAVPANINSNYPYTTSSIPSTLEMNYLTDSANKYKKAQNTEFPERAIFNNPPVVQALKQQGYSYLNVGSWWTDTRKIPTANVNYTEPFKLHFFGIQKTLSEFEYGLLSKSVFGRFLIAGIGWGKSKPIIMASYDTASLTKYQFDTLKQIAQSPSQGGRFIFGHILSPHPPFAFNADGSSPVYSSDLNDVGASIETKYVNQLRYINGQTQSLIDDIDRNAKQPPVIIIQSDEGPHPRQMGTTDDELASFDLTTLPMLNLHQKYGILAAYRLPGATPQDIARLNSPVNVFRVVLDHYFGYTLGNLPSCSFASGLGQKTLDFRDITSLLNGSEDPRCANMHK